MEHIEEPFHWGIAMNLMLKGFKVTNPLTPIDDYIYYDGQVNKFYCVYKDSRVEKQFSQGEKYSSSYKLVK